MDKKCALHDGNFDKFYKNIKDMIANIGFQNICVTADEDHPTFTYTIGLSEKYGFELIVMGLPPEFGMKIFNDIGLGYLAAGNTLELDVPDERWTNLPVMFKECDDILASAFVVQALQYYQTPVKVIQMVLSDREGLLPTSELYDFDYMSKFQWLLYEQE